MARTWRNKRMGTRLFSIRTDLPFGCLWGERLMRIVARPVVWALIAWMVCQWSASFSAAQNPADDLPVIFDNVSTNGELDSSGASPASQTDPAFPFDAGAADDFTLPASPLCRWVVSRVQWTGKYWDQSIPGSITGFRILFWADEDGLPRSGVSTVPDRLLAIASFGIAARAGEAPSASGAPNAFDYEATLPQALELMPGIRYWIQIQAEAEFPPQWGLHITPNRQGLGPVQYFDLLSVPAWTPVPDDGDLAFRLLGRPQVANCDDGTACTADTCVAGVCVSTPMVCDDGNACTIDSCDPSVGCQTAPITCDDGNACTVDSCDPARGCETAPVTCDDGDPCTEDSCDPTKGCVFSALDCQDADPCTTDVCNGGACEHREPPDFDGDGDVDLTDYAVIARCVMDAQRNMVVTCVCADLNGDGPINLKDVAEFQVAYNGSK